MLSGQKKYAAMEIQAQDVERSKKSKIWQALNPERLVVDDINSSTDVRKVGVRDLSGLDIEVSTPSMVEVAPGVFVPEENYSDEDGGDAEECDENESEEQRVARARANASSALGEFASMAEGIGDEDDSEDSDGGLEDNMDVIAMIEKRRAARAAEEEAHREELRKRYAEEKALKDMKINEEQAMFAAEKLAKKEAEDRRKSGMFREASVRMESELSFSGFSWAN